MSNLTSAQTLQIGMFSGEEMVASSLTCFNGSLLGRSSAGLAKLWDGTAGEEFLGIAAENVVSGSLVKVRRDAALIKGVSGSVTGINVTGASAATDQGKPVYCSTDNPTDFTLTPDDSAPIGVVEKWISGANCWVRVVPTTALLEAGVVYQGAPTAETTAATIAAADLWSKIITVTHSAGATQAYTLDTGTAMDTALAHRVPINHGFYWTLINLSSALADTATVTAATGHTIVGEAVVESAHADSEFQSSGRFFSRRTAANTWVTYRIS